MWLKYVQTFTAWMTKHSVWKHIFADYNYANWVYYYNNITKQYQFQDAVNLHLIFVMYFVNK